MTTTTTALLFTTLAACTSIPTVAPAIDAGDPGADATPPDAFEPPPPIAMIETSVIDERADAISFTSDAPVHAHVGPAIALGTGCPDVYKFAYLTDAGGPAFGSETTANPLAYQFATTVPGTPRYRVLDAHGATLLDWADAPASGDHFAIELHRKGPRPLAALDVDGQLQLEVALGTTTLSRCMMYHPLAAPLAWDQATIDTSHAANSLANLPLAGQADRFMGLFAQDSAYVFVQPVVQYTGEPIVIDLAFQPPTASYTETVVDTWVVTGHSTTTTNCSVQPPSPLCHSGQINLPDAVVTGNLDVTYGIQLIDVATGAVPTFCTDVTPTSIHCVVPPRAAGAGPKAYAVAAIGGAFGRIAPGGTDAPLLANTLLSVKYLGVYPTSDYRCTAKTGSFGVAYCTADDAIAHLQAIGALKVDFGPATFAATEGGQPIRYAPTATFATAPSTWNAGTAPMPGR